jgi:hypothetical protein
MPEHAGYLVCLRESCSLTINLFPIGSLAKYFLAIFSDITILSGASSTCSWIAFYKVNIEHFEEGRISIIPLCFRKLHQVIFSESNKLAS